ncbi:MAG: hypothetical protein PHE73_01315 [Sulfurovaceae bacterium]|nr:hypothetical protein [Sulfurovaceae bacterium]
MSKLYGLANAIYHKIPNNPRWILYLFALCYRSLGKFINKYRIDFWIIEGKETNSQTSLSILCAANDQDRSYLARLVFGSAYSEFYFGRSWLWNVRKIVDEIGQEYSMLLVSIKNSRRKFLKIDNCFYIPDWVSGAIDLPLSPKIMSRESFKSDLRRIKKNVLEFEITQEIQQFDDFYHNMYVPYITRAHGSSAYLHSYEVKKKQFQDNELLLVTKSKKYIAGILIRYSKGNPLLSSLGIQDGNTEYLGYGAMGALYHFSLQHAEDKGFSKMNAGMSRTFLRDGVLQYKRKWGHRIINMSSKKFALKILSDTPATRAFLENNPFIFDNQDSPCGAVFVNSKEMISRKLIEQIDKDYFYPGLSKLFIYLPQGDDTLKSNVVPPELSERIFLRSLRDFI